MATLTQDHRPLKLTTPLGHDALLLIGFEGREAISELFHFNVEALAVRQQPVPFDQLLGQPVLVEHADGERNPRCFHGIVSRIGELGGDDAFITYRLEIVPALWLLSLNVQSRIFQQQTVPEILAAVLRGQQVSFQLQSTYMPHNYCVQYGESDFHFASRLMEEEGIYYYFAHSAAGHQLVIADRSVDSPELPRQPRARFDFAAGAEQRGPGIDRWQKFQELRPGRFTVWDHSFALPGYHLDASAEAGAPTRAGAVSHDLGLGLRQDVQIFDYPGDYAHRFDAIGPNGELRDEELRTVFEQNVRTAQMRMQEQLAQSLRVEGAGNCLHFTPGYRFQLEGHPHASGEYLLTRVEHAVRLPDYRSQAAATEPYRNRFTCLPRDLAFRPPRRTPRVRVAGSQTATVVGPKDQEIWTDRFGRIKVHFHWDRHGQGDGLDSCWVRVATNWAGKGFGLVTLPRIGQEVVVDFLEGDPDQPLVTGSVYNAEQVAPFGLPGNRSVTAFKTQTVQGGDGAFHGLAFDDEKDKELICLRSQKDLLVSTVRNHTTYVPSHHFLQVGTGQVIVVGGLPMPYTAGNRADNGEAEAEHHEGEEGEEEEPSEVGDWLKWMGVEMHPVPLAVDIQATYGAELGMVAGIKAYYDFPASVSCVVDPLGVIGGLAVQLAPGAARLAAAAAGLTGETNIVYGYQTELHYGPLVEVRRGPVFRAHDHLKVPTAILAVCHAGSMLLTIALPAVLAPFQIGPWLKNATAISFGIATGLQWLTTQMELRWSKAVAALDAAEEALEKAEQALEQLNPETADSFAEQVTQLVADATNLGADIRKLQLTCLTNVISGPYALTAGEVQVAARASRSGTGHVNFDADGNINLNPTGKLTAHAGGKLALRGKSLTANCAPAGKLTLACGDLLPTGFFGMDAQEIILQYGPVFAPLASIKMSGQGIVLTCGINTIEVSPTGIALNGLQLQVDAVTNAVKAVAQQIT